MIYFKSRTFMIIVGLGLVIRMAVWLWVGLHEEKIFTGDGNEFEQIASNFAEYGCYSKSVHDPSIPDTRRTPLYPAWIALWKIITGSAYHPMIVTGTHFVFYLFIAVMIWFIARRFFTPAVSAIALSLYCFDPSSIANGSLLMAETMYAFFCTLFVFLLIQTIHEKKYRWGILGGLVLGLMTLTKPMSFYFVFLILPVVIFLAIKYKDQIKYVVITYLVLLTFFTLTVSPWIARNYSIAGITQVSSIQDYQLLYYQAATVKAKAENITRNEAVERIRNEINEPQLIFSDDIVTKERLAIYRQKAFEIISDHWDIFLSYYLVSKFIILVDPDRFTLASILYDRQETGFFNSIGDFDGLTAAGAQLFQQKKLVMILIPNFIILLLAIAGMAVTIWQINREPHRRPVLLILLLLIILHVAMTGLTPWARFRVMFYPLMALFAAPGVYSIIMYVKETVYKKFRPDRGN